ncbi:unnamed protein product [Urochloa decumbens]|uniref:Uncharacterized protein n=1 Tax=Urochloa decumbens TaxID=240449 RepID=A0ABC9BEI6_9POAL
MQSWKGKSNEEGAKVSRQRDGRGYGPKEKPRHLYLVLDDWSWGYSIRKIDLSFSDSIRKIYLSLCDDDDDSDPKLIPIDDGQTGAIYNGLPSALIRFPGRRGEPKSILGAFDNMILAMQPLDYQVNNLVQHYSTAIDIRMRTYIDGPWQDTWQDVRNPICIPVGGKLFFLGDDSFRMLCQSYDDTCICNTAWVWSELPKPIFQYELVTSYAVHPDERTIFVSGSFGVPTTFSIDTADPATFSSEEPIIREWKQHGLWQLPFTGRGYFDPELDAWIGLSTELDTIGHIVSCDVASPDSDRNQQQCSSLKFSKERLFSEVPTQRHIGATLVYMGGESKFCLLEGIYIQAGIADQPTGCGEMKFVDELNETEADKYSACELDDERNEFSDSEVNEEQDQKRFLRLTTFSLKYDMNGDLTTGNSRRVCYYSLPQEVTDPMLKYPVAFWI